MNTIKLKFHIPTQQFGFLEAEGDVENTKELEIIYNKYAEVPLRFSEGVFEKIKTFTGEEVLYNEQTHVYTDLNGNRLMSGSAFKKQFDKSFDLNLLSSKVAKKYNISQQIVKNMWSHNGFTSMHLGNAIHWAMEQWFSFKDTGTEKDYHLPKHPFLNEMIDSFPLKNEEVLPEIVVSDVKNNRVGRVDGIQKTGPKKCNIIDYKSDAQIKDKVDGHFLQLSFYAHILLNYGWEVEKVVVWNYTDKWTKYESEVIDIDKLKVEHK